MLKKWGLRGHARWVSFIAFVVCLAFFQNMSFLTEEPTQPAAEMNRPPDDIAQYLPPTPHGDSPNAIANEILEHNFGAYFHELQTDLERRYGQWLRPTFEVSAGAEDASSVGTGTGAGSPSEGRHSSYGVSLLNVGTLGFNYDGGVRLRCEYSMGSRALQVSLNKALSARSSLFIRHSTEDGRTNLSYNYRW